MIWLDHFFVLSDHDLIEDHIFPSDRDLIGDREKSDYANLCIEVGSKWHKSNFGMKLLPLSKSL